MLKFLVTKAPQGFQGDLVPQTGLATEFSHFGVDEALNSPKDVGIGPPLSRYGVLIVSVCSAFSLLRILSTRVAALSCLECTSPAPTRLDENRTVSGPFPDHVFAPSLVPAQQRWQNHPGSKRNHPTVARTVWIESRKHPCNRRLCPTRMKMALPISVGNSNGLFHWLSAPTFCVHWCPRFGVVHTPRATRTARVRLCSPRHREPPPGIGAPEAGRPTGSRKQPSGCWRGISSPGAPTGLSKAREGQHHCSMDGSQCEGRELCLVKGR
jgi:hypothetical protein